VLFSHYNERRNQKTPLRKLFKPPKTTFYMNIEIISQDKNNLEVKIDNPTIVEILRVYLNNQGIDFAAWRREHPSKPIIFKIQSSDKTIKKAISDAIESIKKDLEKISSTLKKK